MFFTETLESKETKISHLQRRRRRRARHTWWNETLSKTMKNQTGYIRRLVMPQQNVHILFMEADSGMGQWANELLKYTRPNPAALGAPWKRKKNFTQHKTASKCHFFCLEAFKTRSQICWCLSRKWDTGCGYLNTWTGGSGYAAC